MTQNLNKYRQIKKVFFSTIKIKMRQRIFITELAGCKKTSPGKSHIYILTRKVLGEILWEWEEKPWKL